MSNWQVLGGVGASGRKTTVVTMTTVAFLIAAGCGPEKTLPRRSPADRWSSHDEATARLVGGIEGTVLTLGDHAYPHGSSENFAECYDPSWGQFKARTPEKGEIFSDSGVARCH